jgi:hypothetical protein
LLCQDSKFSLGHVKPAAVFGCVMPFEALSQAPCLLWLEGFVKRGAGVWVLKLSCTRTIFSAFAK